MRRFFIGGFAAGVALISVPASSQVKPQEAPSSAATAPAVPNASMPEPAACEVPQTPATPDALAEPAAFAKAARRYSELLEFTTKLEREREQREFERSAERYAKYREFTLQLEALQELQVEQSFNESIELYLRKQEFTKRLLDQRRASATGALPVKP
jgi:hypothetical protein